MSKAILVLEIFTFLSWLIDYVEKRLNKKARFNFTIYDVRDWTVLCKISRSKCIQAMKFGQLIEYSMKNIFLDPYFSRYFVPDPFLKNQNWAYL